MKKQKKIDYGFGNYADNFSVLGRAIWLHKHGSKDEAREIFEAFIEWESTHTEPKSSRYLLPFVKEILSGEAA